MGILGLAVLFGMFVVLVGRLVGTPRRPEDEQDSEDLSRSVGRAINGISETAPSIFGQPFQVPDPPPPDLEIGDDHVLHLEVAPSHPDVPPELEVQGRVDAPTLGRSR